MLLVAEETPRMCSRYSLISPPEAVRELFSCVGEAAFPPRYNIAPTDPVLIVRNDDKQIRELVLVRWGLVPAWAKDPRDFSLLINARGETAAEKPSFRGAFRHRRCLVPTDGYYEWTGPRGSKQPHLTRPRGGGLFAMAGLWESWLGADGSEIETMAIITTSASPDVAQVHDRMPVLIHPDDFSRWLDCRPGSAETVRDLVRTPPGGTLETLAVSRKLNNPRSEGPDLLLP
jgi:putative SOS response-associated peptidase YedK